MVTKGEDLIKRHTKKTIAFPFVCLICMTIFLATSVMAQGDENAAPLQSSPLNDINITGFFDVVGSYNATSDDETDFGLGQAEVDLERSWSNKVSAAIAIAFNNSTSQFELGAAELNIPLYTSDNGFLRDVNITAEQFDVPFGLDYRVFASINRKFISPPWFVDVHGGWRGWNDNGVQAHMQFNNIDITTFWVNGFEESATVTRRIMNLATGIEDTVIEEIDTTPANALGGRLSLFPINNLEVGGSLATGLNNSNRQEMYLTDLHAEYIRDALSTRAEVVWHSVNRSISPETHTGYYLQGIYEFNKPFVMLRYSSFKPHAQDRVLLTTLGAGYKLAQQTEFRYETQLSSNTNNVEHHFQLVTGF